MPSASPTPRSGSSPGTNSSTTSATAPAWSPSDQILTEVSLYWFTNTSAAAGRYHYEEANAGAEPQLNHAPTGVAVFADDFKTIRPLAERDNTNIVHWSNYDKGGHFASLERPEEVTADLRKFFRNL